MVDVSDRHDIEVALRDSEDRFRGAFDDAAIALGIASLDGKLARVNTAHCDLLGYSDAELIGMDVRRLIHPDDLTSTSERRADLLAGKIHSYNEERRYLHKDGHVVWGLANVSLTRDRDGKPLSILAQVRDITGRKLAEEALRESEERFRGAFAYSTVGMSLSTPEGRYFRVNPAFCEMLGYDEKQLLNLTFDAITYRDDQAEGHAYRKRLLAGEIDHFQIETRYHHAGGHPIWVLLSVSIVRASLGIAFNRPSGLPPAALLRNADVALYRAKRAGGSQYTVHDEDSLGAHIGTTELRATYS